MSNLTRKIASIIASFSILFNSLATPALIVAQEITPTPTPAPTPSISIDKSDYLYNDTAIITGVNFEINSQLTIHIESLDEPPVNHAAGT